MHERLFAKILLTLAAVIGFVAAAMAVTAGPADAGRPDPVRLVPCRNDQLISARLSHDDKVKETLEPGEQAGRWKQMTARTRLGALREQQVIYDAPDARDIAFVDDAGRVKAVLSFERSDYLGWRLESIVECAS